jgi:hypothetical protein
MPRISRLAFVLLASAALSQAQWPRVASQKRPRTREGTPWADALHQERTVGR